MENKILVILNFLKAERNQKIKELIQLILKELLNKNKRSTGLVLVNQICTFVV